MKRPLRIYLTGFMGSGKSTLGPRLADSLSYAFLDLDEFVEERAGKSISKIFDENGEAVFRQMEQEALVELGSRENLVAALGGGALATVEKMQSALRDALVVYLCASEDTLKKRLYAETSNRPLLKPGSSISTLLVSRDPVYRRAHIVFGVDELSVDEAVSELLAEIESYRQNG